MTSTYLGRGFSHGENPQPPPQPAPQAAAMPPIFPVRDVNTLYGGVSEQQHPFPTRLGGGGLSLFASQNQQPEGAAYPKGNDEDDRQSEHSDHSSHASHRSSHSSGSRHRHSASYEDYEPSSSSSEDEHEGSSNNKAAEEAFYDYRFVWATGFFLLLASAAYFYWITTWDCCTTENEETNMTMQYAIDQFTRAKTEPKEPGAPTETQEGEGSVAH